MTDINPELEDLAHRMLVDEAENAGVVLTPLPTTRVSIYHPISPVGPPPGAAVAICVQQLLAELEAEPVVTLTTQEELLTALDELLDNALHGPECYIGPEDTHCVCVIDRVRAVLPRCEAVQERGRLGEPGDTSYWRCQRSAHPASPDRHFFSED